MILDAVKERGDEALFEYTKKFDGADIHSSNILVTEDEIKEAYDTVDPGLIEVIRKRLSISDPTMRNRCSTAGLTADRTERSSGRR